MQPQILTEPSQGYTVAFTIIKSKNLPKCDTLGKIDAYYKLYVNGSEVGQTDVKQMDYSPKHKKTFRVKFHNWNDLVAANYYIELYDKDKVGKDDFVGSYRFQPGNNMSRKSYVFLELNKGFKPSDKAEHSTLFYSYGWMKSKEHLANAISTQNPAGVHIHKDKVINQIGTAFGLAPEAVILAAEYEKDELDIKLWVTVPENVCDKLFELAYSSSGLKYVCQKKSFPKGEKISDYVVYTELKIDDVPFHFDFRQLTLTVSEKKELFSGTVEQITYRHGWAGQMTYTDAKKKLRDSIFDDKHKGIYMCEPEACLYTDFGKDDGDFMWGVYESDAAKGHIADMVNGKKSTQTRQLVYYSKPKKMTGSNHVSMLVKLDDVGYDALFVDLKLFLYQRVNPSTHFLYTYLPCQ